MFPALALGLAILVFTFTGNGLEDALAPGSDR
jgi:ABC-type dipeptide/oligopeptide/nickel transport system permease subunit